LLFDLLTAAEEREDATSGRFRFDIEMLGDRLALATDWARAQTTLRALPLGYFGASTGAAAALWAAAGRADRVRAVVSRGGRPDLAAPHVRRVRAPTLLIVGSKDPQVLAFNRQILSDFAVEHELAVVEGATHLFEEPGALDEVARLASLWFARHLSGARP
jgi:putative phosphoribosyl transferase